MKKILFSLLVIVSFSFVGLYAKRHFRIQLIPKAKAQAGKLEAPTDMPIPKEVLNDGLPEGGDANAPPPMPPPVDEGTPQLGVRPNNPGVAIPNQQTAPVMQQQMKLPNLAKPAPKKEVPQIAPLPPPMEDIPLVQDQFQGKNPQEIDPSLKLLGNEGFVYDPTGRRDPFKSFIIAVKQEVQVQQSNEEPTPTTKSLIPSFLLRPSDESLGNTLESKDVAEFKLIGIMWDVNDPKAMISSGSKVFMVKRKTRIGRNNGYVAAIREGEVVIIELTNDAKTPTTRVLTLQK